MVTTLYVCIFQDFFLCLVQITFEEVFGLKVLHIVVNVIYRNVSAKDAVKAKKEKGKRSFG